MLAKYFLTNQEARSALTPSPSPHLGRGARREGIIRVSGIRQEHPGLTLLAKYKVVHHTSVGMVRWQR